MLPLRLPPAVVGIPPQQPPYQQHRVFLPREEAALVAGGEWQAASVHSVGSRGGVSFHASHHDIQDF